MNKGLEALKELWNGKDIKECREQTYDVIEKELKVLEIIKKYPRNRMSLQSFRYYVKYWEDNNIKITKELLENYDFPFEVEEYDLLREVLL